VPDGMPHYFCGILSDCPQRGLREQLVAKLLEVLQLRAVLASIPEHRVQPGYGLHTADPPTMARPLFAADSHMAELASAVAGTGEHLAGEDDRRTETP